MATRKRNEWLEAEESDDEAGGYNSEAEEESRARALPRSKRQKVDHNSEDESGSEEDDFEAFSDEDDASDAEENEEDKAHAARLSKHSKTNKSATSSEIAHLESIAKALPNSKLNDLNLTAQLPLGPKKDKSGIIYLSRCPPFMKPSVLRNLLTPYGAVGRIFLTPESTTQRSQRLKSGGTRRKMFLDGWVEFLKKKDAKFVADNLNAQTMGGRKRSRWHDEVWNIKYLSGVKWSHLVEQIQNENAERQARMRAEISQSKRENQRFLEDVERGKIGKTMSDRKKTRGKAEDQTDEDGEKEEKKSKAPQREFKQVVVLNKTENKPEPGQNVQRVLSKMF